MASLVRTELVEKHLECGICSERFQEPKMLECQHSYCRKCLEGLMTECEITCPECKRKTKVPNGDLKSLPVNHSLISKLLSIPSNAKSAADPSCKQHHRETLKLFFQSCDQLICRDCAVSIDHRGHKYFRIIEIFSAEVSKINKVVEESKQKVHDLESSIETMKERKDSLIKNAMDVDLDMDIIMDDKILEIERQNLSVGIKMQESEDRRQSLEEEREDLEKERQGLERDIQGLEKQRQSLEKNRQGLEKERQNLEEKRRSIQEDRQNLEEERQLAEEATDLSYLKATEGQMFKQRRNLEDKEERRNLEEKIKSIRERKHNLKEKRRSLEEQRQNLENNWQSLEEKRQSLEEKRRTLEEKRHTLEEKRHSLAEKRRQVEKERRCLEANRQSLKEERQSSEEERRRLQSNVQALVSTQKQELENAMDSLVSSLDSLKTSTDAISDSLSNNSQVEILSAKNDIIQLLTELNSVKSDLTLSGPTSFTLKFKDLILKMIEFHPEYELLIVNTITGVESTELTLSLGASGYRKFLICSRNKDHISTFGNAYRAQVKITTPNGFVWYPKVAKNADSSFSFRYHPEESGNHKIVIFVNDRYVCGNPFNLEVVV